MVSLTISGLATKRTLKRRFEPFWAIAIALSLVVPQIAAASGSSVAIVANLGGALTVRDPSGASHDVGSAQPLRSGETVMTGVNTLASIAAAGLLRARLAADTAVQYSTSNAGTLLRLTAGTMCVAADAPALTVSAGGATLSIASAPAVFDIDSQPSGAEIALYIGSISTANADGSTKVVQAPAALRLSNAANPAALAFQSTAQEFTSLPCPDRDDAERAASEAASPVPSPEVTVAPSSGGGAGGVLGLLAGLAGLAALAGHGGGGGGGGSGGTGSSPTPPPGTLSANPTALSFASQTATPKTFTASESNYTGAISASTGNAAVATVSGGGNGPGPVTFTVTPVGAGTTTITVSDGRGGSVAVGITVSGPLLLSQQTLAFTSPTAGAKTFTASEADYSGPLSAASNDTTIASVSGSGSGPGPVTFTVTPVGAGNTQIVVSDGQGNSASVNVSVAGKLVANPTSLTFNVGGPSQNVGVSEANYTGAITGVSNNDLVAVVTGGGNGPGPVAFTVTPVETGSTTLTFSDTHGNTVSVSVTVQTPGQLQVNPTSIGPIGVNAAGQTVTASESNYAGAISAESSDPTIATVSGGGDGPGPVTFTVTPAGNDKHGDVTVTVSDTIGHSVHVAVSVAGPISPSVKSLSFTGTSTPQMFTATDPNNTPSGTLNATSDNESVATVSGSGAAPGPVTFTVTPVGQGTAHVTVTDNIGQSAVVTISVSTGGLVLNPTKLALYFNGSSGASEQFTATQANFTGTITAATGNSSIATVSPTSGQGPGPVTFTVTPEGAGNTNITVTGNGSAALPVVVSGPLTTIPQTLTFSGTTNPQTFVANDPNFTGTISASSDAPGVATVNASGTGPSATFTVTPVSKGNATVTVTDGVGGSAAVSVTVKTGTLGVAPTSLTFNSTSSPTQTATASENNYIGNITPSNCSIASFSPTVGQGPIQAFLVGPVAVGTCQADVVTSDQQTTLTITVLGALMVNPTSLSFSDVSVEQTVNISESEYTGSFTVADNTCSGIATVGSPSGPGPSATIAVTSSVSASGGACGFALQDNHGGSQAVSVTVGPFGVVNPSPSSLNLSVTSPSSGTVNVGESGYTGSFTATSSDCSGVATFNAGPATTLTVNAAASGSCTITMHDDHGQTAAVSVSVAGALMVSPTSHTFTDVGVTTPIAISEQNYTGLFNVTNSADCAGIATFSALSGSGPSFTLGVTSAGSGSCTFDVTDAFGASVPVTIAVGPFGTVMTAPNPLTINTANDTSGNITASESNYSGQFTAASTDCSGIATFPAGPATTFAVTASAAGTCHIQFTDDHGGTGSDTVIVDGTLTLTPNPIAFSDINVTTPLAIAEPNYGGTFATANSTCAGVATIGTPAGPGPSTTLNVTSLTMGSCTFAVQDAGGQSVTETVDVGPFGTVTPSTTQINLNTGGPTTGTFMVSETGYTGQFTATLGPTCGSVASVSPGSGDSTTTFTVTALGVGTCGVHVADDHGQSTIIPVEVASGGMFVNPASLLFPTTTSPAQNFTATDPLGFSFTVANPDPTDLTVTWVNNLGSATVTAQPTNSNPAFSGTIALTVTDNVPGSSAVVEVGIAVQSPLSKRHRIPPGGGKRVAPHPIAPHPGAPHQGGPHPIVPRPAGPLSAPLRFAPPVLVVDPVARGVPAKEPFDLTPAVATLSQLGARLVIQARGTPDGALAAVSSDPNVCAVQIVSGAGASRSIVVIAKAAGAAIVRVTDARGDVRTVSIRVTIAPALRDVPHAPGGPR